MVQQTFPKVDPKIGGSIMNLKYTDRIGMKYTRIAHRSNMITKFDFYRAEKHAHHGFIGYSHHGVEVILNHDCVGSHG